MISEKTRGFYLHFIWIKVAWMQGIVLLMSPIASANQFTNGINPSSWRVSLSVFECRIEHQVPFYGKGVFEKRAGHKACFYLDPESKEFKLGKAAMRSIAPVWKNTATEQLLKYSPVHNNWRTIREGEKGTELLLAALLEGNAVEIMRKSWFKDKTQPSATVELSPIGFRHVYRQYLACLENLLPKSFDQLRRTTLLFPSGEQDIFLKKHQAVLDNMTMLARHDETIQAFYIDGHTDGRGLRTDNLALAKLRAERVAAYLKRAGIPENQIVVRWHGERYPVASNDTPVGRQQNRRVTIRLERDMPEKPSMNDVDALTLNQESGEV